MRDDIMGDIMKDIINMTSSRDTKFIQNCCFNGNMMMIKHWTLGYGTLLLVKPLKSIQPARP